MKAQFNFFYNGTAITKSQFEKEVGQDWQELLDENFEYAPGYYKVQLVSDELTVDVSDFSINEYMSGYFSIKGMLFGQEIEVLGGDSANEDDYNKEYFENVLEEWDGKLYNYYNGFKIEI